MGKRVVATGYNGALPGDEHCTDVGCSMEDGHCQRAIHAEVNAVAQAAALGISIRGAVLYLYDSQAEAGQRVGVCRECRKVLAAAGVLEVSQE